jgi:hypothetical protein
MRDPLARSSNLHTFFALFGAGADGVPVSAAGVADWSAAVIEASINASTKDIGFPN